MIPVVRESMYTFELAYILIFKVNSSQTHSLYKYVHVVIIIILVLICYTATNLTVKVLCLLPYVLKDHKVKPSHEKLMTITPVSSIIILYFYGIKMHKFYQVIYYMFTHFTLFA